MPFMLVVGFVVDYVTFVSIQVDTALWLLALYCILLGFSMAFLHLFDAGKLGERFKFVRLYMPLVIQFLFGGLLGNSFIFYWFSSSIYVSWPFILLFVVLMVFNDVFRHELLRVKFQIPFYFFLVFSVFSVALPFLFNSLNPNLFISAGFLALIYISFYFWLLVKFLPVLHREKLFISTSILGIFVLMNVLYFSNLVPPVPLVVRDAGVYHSVEKHGSNYLLKGERESFWNKVLPGQTLNLSAQERAYVFSAIYSPRQLNATIVHEWQYYDQIQKAWVKKDSLKFSLTGGRSAGFRGYSWKSSLAEGEWRVFVKTERGQTLGRVKFEVRKSESPVELIEVVK